MNEALAASRLEERTARFQAEQAEKEVSRLKDEAVVNSLRENDLVAKQDSKLRRAFREGKREVAALVRNHSTDFAAHFGELKKTQNSIGDYRECWGSVVVLWRTQEPEYSYDAEMTNMSRHMRNYANVESMILLIEERIWEQWAPIPVSPDSEEVSP